MTMTEKAALVEAEAAADDVMAAMVEACDRLLALQAAEAEAEARRAAEAEAA